MADVVDLAADLQAAHLDAAIGRARCAVPAGVAGECDGCGETMPRLVGGLCGFCRDGRVPPPDWEPPAIVETIPAAKPSPPDAYAAVMPPVLTKETVMSTSKSITFVATGPVLDEIKRRTADGTSNNRAAMDLIEAGIAAAGKTAGSTAPAAVADIASLDTQALLGEIARRMEGAVSGDAMRAAETKAAEAMTRADEAEARLASIRAAIG